MNDEKIALTQKKSDHQEGQALVVILLMLVIAAIIAAAIAYRTIQDVRRTGEERQSSKALTQSESFIDVVTSESQWDLIFDGGGFDADGLCGVGGGYDPETGVCTLDEADLAGILGEDPACEPETAEVQIRLGDGLGEDYSILGQSVTQDYVMELNLEGSSGDYNFCVGWSGSEYLEVKVYWLNGDEYLVENAKALSHNASAAYGTFVQAGECYTISYSANALLARIKPIDGNATVDVTSLDAPQLATVKASCYVGDTYREIVRRIDLYPEVPAIFDYVLFAGSGSVDK